MQQESLAAVVRRRREDRGFSQRELARLAQVDSAEISRIESGDRMRPRVETLWKIAPHLALDPVELVRIARELPGDTDAMRDADERVARRRPTRQRDPGIERAFADRLQQLRAAAGLERDELARRVGITYAAITRYELGSLPEVPVVCRLADEFGVSVDQLLGRPGGRAVDITGDSSPRLVIYTTDLELEGDSAEDWRKYLTQLIGLTKRMTDRDREVILNVSRQLVASK